MRRKESVTRTVVKDNEGNEYHLETLLSEVVDRAHVCGLLLEETLLHHPYFEVVQDNKLLKEALSRLWDLYEHLKKEKTKLEDD